MDLRSGLSYWRAIEAPSVEYSPLSGDANCEVVVLGGGVTGAAVAYFLVREGVDTLLVDRGEFAAGSTAASTGLLQYEIDTPLSKLIRKIGQVHAVHAFRRGLRAVDEIEALVGELGDGCGFSRRNTLCFASRSWHLGALKREFDCRKEHGFDVQFLDRKALADRSSIRASGAIYAAGDGQLDPYRFTLRMIEKAHVAGLRAFPSTDVLEIKQDADKVFVRTERGNIRAGKIVFATGYESQKYVRQKIGGLNSTYAVASEPLESFAGWPDGCLIWETARPYFYARQSEDGRAMIGGEDTAFHDDHERDGLVERKVERLQARFEQLFPEVAFVPAYAWAGTFGETQDGLAYIGQPHDQPRAYFAVGYGGNGITFGVIAARLITDLYVGRPNADAAVFRFGR
jgi:glycine/D-amino acid oxidase-like deaminating enzyme